MNDSGEKEKDINAEDIAETEPISEVTRTKEEMRRT